MCITEFVLFVPVETIAIAGVELFSVALATCPDSMRTGPTSAFTNIVESTPPTLLVVLVLVCEDDVVPVNPVQLSLFYT